MGKELTPSHIMQVGLGFWASKTLLSALEMGLFTELARNPLGKDELQSKFSLHDRSAGDFLDALVALKFLEREAGIYKNTAETDFFLDKNKPAYIGGILEMANARLYAFWGALSEALRTGLPQNEAKSGGNFFEAIYGDPDSLEKFLKAMTGISLGSAMAISEKFPWLDFKTFVDVGCAEGGQTVVIARRHDHLTGVGFDLPPVGPVFQKYVDENKLSERITFQAGDFFEDDLPRADVILMGHILHDWDLEQKKLLLQKSYDALPDGGALIVYEAIIDDDRRENAFGLLMSLNMLIETPGGFDYTGADCSAWMREIGFSETRVEHLLGPDSMVIGTK